MGSLHLLKVLIWMLYMTIHIASVCAVMSVEVVIADY